MGPATLEPGEYQTGARFFTHYNVNDTFNAFNVIDKDGNPTGGIVESVGINIKWQDGPRGPVSSDQVVGPDGLLPANGAFVEDVIYAALQRLEFFNKTQYRDRANSIAITHLEEALQSLKHRQVERSFRGVEGKHEV